MYLCTNDVHVPRWPHERFRGKSPMGLRGEAILQLDWTVGRVLDHLRELGIADNTLVILTSDNGPVLDDGYADQAEELAGTHRPGGHWRGGKYSAFEAGSAVPFIVSWPAGGVPRGRGVQWVQVFDSAWSQIDDGGVTSMNDAVTLPRTLDYKASDATVSMDPFSMHIYLSSVDSSPAQ